MSISVGSVLKSLPGDVDVGQDQDERTAACVGYALKDHLGGLCKSPSKSDPHVVQRLGQIVSALSSISCYIWMK
jgi:hypothetical protein